ncbi:hypothetical protein [Croceivirga thetidis]|uniref:Lipocalin-like domain-containing protein n=1 Tax=Croceivirga thetidis TaxID=2721623 RepID=A0ABX1GT19_9FLAO|nr:hypothetical protein [Croceivirga thetidis]NKI32759.1 hypothetical protein [Croceivirga thetidis]
MKKVFLLIFISIVVNSCTEDGDTLLTDGVNGKWQLEATKISPGSLVLEWTEIENGEVYWFSSEGTYQKIKGEITDSGQFNYNGQFLTLDSEAIGNEVRFYVSFEGEKMILAFFGCIEECSYRYRRIS